MYWMVLSGTDTTQVILSDWRNTGSRSEKWRCSAKVAGYWVIPNGNILGLAMRIHLPMHIIRICRIGPYSATEWATLTNMDSSVCSKLSRCQFYEFLKDWTLVRIVKNRPNQGRPRVQEKVNSAVVDEPGRELTNWKKNGSKANNWISNGPKAIKPVSKNSSILSTGVIHAEAGCRGQNLRLLNQEEVAR